MKSIPHPERNAKLDAPKFKLRCIAQGGLFTLKIVSGLRSQQKKSVSDDFRESWKLRRAVTRVLLDAAENRSDPYCDVWLRIAADPDPHLVALLGQGLRLKSCVTHKKRGQVTEFSRKSRLRLLRQGAVLRKSTTGLFITLTYRENMQDVTLAKKHLEKFLLWLKRFDATKATLWRMEFQERGAVHFHLIVLNRQFIPVEKITEYWHKITGDDSYPQVEKLRSRRGVIRYIAKYLAKVTQAATIAETWVTAEPGDLGFNYKPYSDNYVGRYWGVTNRKCLPLAPAVEIDVTDDAGKVLFGLRRYARRYYKRLNKRVQGFSLFVNEPGRWISLLYHVILEL